MIRVLIADDDYLARMYLKQLIDWEAEGYLLTCDTCNGKEALEQIETADIVLTDISMPVMDGIELIQHIKEKGVACRIAVLSCHDEFEYVKEAMRLGADEYILKNTLEAKSLLALLDKLKTDLQQTIQEKKEQKRLIELAQQGSRTQRNQVLQDFRDKSYTVAQQQERLSTCGIQSSLYQCAAVFVHWQDDARSETAINVCEQFIRHWKAYSFHTLQKGTLFVFLDLTGIASLKEQADKFHGFVSELERTFSHYVGCTPFLAASGLCVGDGSITKAIHQAEEAAAFFYYGQRLCWSEELPVMVQAMPVTAEQALQLAGSHLCDVEQFAKVFSQTLEECMRLPVHPEKIKNWIIKLDAACGLLSQDVPCSIDDCFLRLKEYQGVLDARKQQYELQASNPVVAQAVSFVRTHFSEPISLGAVADAVGLNAAYLSYVFKQNTGVNFSDYLLQCRMDVVKQQLRETILPIKEIAVAAGFMDYRYFCKLFKKETGMRPAEFRKNPQK